MAGTSVERISIRRPETWTPPGGTSAAGLRHPLNRTAPAAHDPGTSLAARTLDAASNHHRRSPNRLFWLAVQTLARQFLSAKDAAEPLARVLRDAVRYGRDQQHLLSPP